MKTPGAQRRMTPAGWRGCDGGGTLASPRPLRPSLPFSDGVGQSTLHASELPPPLPAEPDLAVHVELPVETEHLRL